MDSEGYKDKKQPKLKKFLYYRITAHQSVKKSQKTQMFENIQNRLYQHLLSKNDVFHVEKLSS